MSLTILVALILIGVIFFVIELFLIPGVSFAGIAGMLFFGGAIYYGYTAIGGMVGHLTLFASLIILAGGIWLFLKMNILEKMSLKTEIDSKIEPLKGLQLVIGQKGITSSRLAPMGKVKINGHVIEAKSNGEFIDEGIEIQVFEIHNTNVLVGKVATSE